VTPQQIEFALTRAQRICTLRGARLTPLRQHVFELILGADQPTRAYALLAQLEEERGKLGPPTVYRALDFLLAHKFIIRSRPPTPLSPAGTSSIRMRANS